MFPIGGITAPGSSLQQSAASSAKGESGSIFGSGQASDFNVSIHSGGLLDAALGESTPMTKVLLVAMLVAGGLFAWRLSKKG